MSPAHLPSSLIPATQHPRDRFMHPGVDLEVARVLGGEPQLYAAIGTYVSAFHITGRIFYGNSEQPLARWPLAYLAFIFH
jgi:hypothetical protein